MQAEALAVQERGRRLGALLFLFGGGSEHHTEFWHGLPLDQQASLDNYGGDDADLANACLEAERWRLDRECRFVEHLLAYDMFGHRELCEALEREDLAAVHYAAMDGLGLLDLEPDPADER